MEIAAIVAVVLLAAIAAFQIALTLGAPLGRAAWGGRHDGVLPKRLRVASGVAGLVVYPLLIVSILVSAGLTQNAWMPSPGKVVMWLFGCGVHAGSSGELRVAFHDRAILGLGVARHCGLLRHHRDRHLSRPPRRLSVATRTFHNASVCSTHQKRRSAFGRSPVLPVPRERCARDHHPHHPSDSGWTVLGPKG